ncbi:matrixin family metalloprotease [Marmoricola sp. RAF53]|uniref:matrixin family metalloprotease n=1 Tax=Marmoricola sp. RAF53 TaxID=3233059 RepID=UPI003F9B6621
MPRALLHPLLLYPVLLVSLLALASPLRTPADRSSTAPEPLTTRAVGGVPVETANAPVAVLPGSPIAAHRYGLFGLRWDPCRPITYRINARGGYRGSTADLRFAFRTIGRATGIVLVYQGRTNRVAFQSGRDPRADITVSWASPSQVRRLRGPVAGLASTAIVRHDGVVENVRGQIALDRTQEVRPGYATSGPPTWGQAFLHEIGHVMGLDHVNGRRQVMNPAITRWNHVLGMGDLLRLRLVGRAAGCIANSAR